MVSPTLQSNDGTSIFEGELSLFFKQVVRVARSHPRIALHFLGMMFKQRRAAKRRDAARKNGISIPPVMIFSITRTCNLQCSGCYARSHSSNSTGAELTVDEFKKTLHEASELGIGSVFLVGGEPLLRRDIVECAATEKNIQFLLFTNGTLIDPPAIALIRKHPNIFPMLSIEGNDRATDARRGEGVYRKIETALTLFKKVRLPFGLSITVTAKNLSEVTGEKLVAAMVKNGCRFFIFVSYIPVQKGTEDLVLGEVGLLELENKLAAFRKQFGALFVSFPGDEKRFGGCLSSGRGFIHVSPGGAIEPCPFSPFSDVSLKDTSLIEALKSPLLKTIRDNHHLLEEHGGGCALFEREEWVRELAAKSSQHRSSEAGLTTGNS